jgi:hypothetical protein
LGTSTPALSADSNQGAFVAFVLEKGGAMRPLFF